MQYQTKNQKMRNVIVLSTVRLYTLLLLICY